MVIEIPDDLYEHFINFLDVAQAMFTKEDLEYFSDDEKRIMEWIEALLGPQRVMRYKMKSDIAEAKWAFTVALARTPGKFPK
jgi:hypothetical protein